MAKKIVLEFRIDFKTIESEQEMKIKKSFKKNKFLFAVGALTLVGITGATIASCSTIQKGQFKMVANDVYGELKMAAKTLDDVGYKSKESTQQTPKTFVQKADEEIKKVKDFIPKVSNKLKELKLIKEDTTALFVKNYNLQYSSDENTLLENLKNFSMEQPILYSSLYDSGDEQNNGTPNLGIKFPTPIDPSGMQYFDDWWEIGASASYNNPSMGRLLAKSWKGTADYVFYLYDSSKLTTEEESTLKKIIFKQTNSENLPAWALLKENVAFKRVIPLDLQYFYNGTWDLIGTEYIVKNIALILAAMKEANLNNSKDGLDEEKLKQDADIAKIKEINATSTFAPKKLTNADKLIAPTDAEGFEKLGVSGFNNLGHLITLGVLPDFVEFNADPEGAKQHLLFSAYLKDKMPNDFAGADNVNMLPFGFGKDAQNHAKVAETKKMYTVLADRSKYGAVASAWTFDSPTINPKAPTAKGLGNLIYNGKIKKATFSERNDSSLSQIALKNGFNLYDITTKQVITQKKYSENHQYL